jgi:hypothetical protein
MLPQAEALRIQLITDQISLYFNIQEYQHSFSPADPLKLYLNTYFKRYEIWGFQREGYSCLWYDSKYFDRQAPIFGTELLLLCSALKMEADDSSGNLTDRAHLLQRFQNLWLHKVETFFKIL